MTDAVVGQTYSEVFELGFVDGLTFTRTKSRIDQTNSSWDADVINDLGDGDYEFVYTPDVDGYHSWAGTSSDGRKVTVNFDVQTAAQADPLAAAVSGYDPGTLAGVLDALDLAPITTTLDDLTAAATSFEAALLLLGSRKVNIVSPIAKDLTLTIYQGDDYDVASDRGISWTFGAEPDLTDAEVTLTISAYRTIRTGSQRIVTKQYITPLTATCTLSGEGTSAQIVTAELTSEQTATLEAGLVGHYDIAAVLASTDDVTLQRGRVKIIPEITA